MNKRLCIVAADVIKTHMEESRDKAPHVFYSMDNKAKLNVAESHIAVGFSGRGRRIILSTDVNMP